MTYWNNSGKYQEYRQELVKLVPMIGKCELTYLELFRITCNAYYDIYNNGGCNSHIFKQLDNELGFYSQPNTFTDSEWDDFIDLIEIAMRDERDGCLNTNPKTLALLERFVDWVILSAYNTHFNRANFSYF
jgi:hypothetical protein